MVVSATFTGRGVKVMSDKERFLKKCMPEPMSGCWLWTAAVDKKTGYGWFFLGKQMNAHRAAYILFNGDLSGLHVRHKCDNRVCVNPAHLEIGTHQDNMDDRGARGRTVRGEDHGKLKFSDEVVQQVRLDYVASKSYAKTGRKFGMSKTQVGNIVRNEQRAVLV